MLCVQVCHCGCRWVVLARSESSSANFSPWTWFDSCRYLSWRNVHLSKVIDTLRTSESTVRLIAARNTELS